MEEIINTCRFTHLSHGKDSQVARVKEIFAVKYGRDVDLLEGRNMVFVAQHLSNWQIRVPKVFALFEDTRSGRKFIVTEWIQGHLLSQVWNSLPKNRKDYFAMKLCRASRNLRAIPAPAGGQWYGSVDGSGVRDRLLQRDGMAPPVFTNENQLLYTLANSYLFAGPIQEDGLPGLATAIIGLDSALRGHTAVFTHAELYPWHIIVADDDGSPVVMNWENAGWYPAYWEYCMALMPDYDWQHITDDWIMYLDLMILGGHAQYRRQLRDLVHARQVVEIDDDAESSVDDDEDSV
jgi:hypothetical protein